MCKSYPVNNVVKSRVRIDFDVCTYKSHTTVIIENRQKCYKEIDMNSVIINFKENPTDVSITVKKD